MMWEKLAQRWRRGRLRKQMRDPDFAEEYAANASDEDWRVLAPSATDAQLERLRALQRSISPVMSFSELVTALEEKCPPENEHSVVVGDLSLRNYGSLGNMFCAELGMYYPLKGLHSVIIMMAALYDENSVARICYDTIAGEEFDPGIYDELRTNYAWLDAARPVKVLAWVEEE